MTKPLQAYISTEVCCTARSAFGHCMCLHDTLQFSLLVQESRKALKCADQFKLVCLNILKSLRTRSVQHEHDMSVGTQLLRIMDPSTGDTSTSFSIDSLKPCHLTKEKCDMYTFVGFCQEGRCQMLSSLPR